MYNYLEETLDVCAVKPLMMRVLSAGYMTLKVSFLIATGNRVTVLLNWYCQTDPQPSSGNEGFEVKNDSVLVWYIEQGSTFVIQHRENI